MAGFEYREVDDVLDAYKNQGMTRWAIFAGTEPIMSHDDDSSGFDKLEQALNHIYNNNSTAVYKLKVYHDDVKQITKKTPEAAVLRFMLGTDSYGRDKVQPGADGKGLVIMRGERSVGSTGNNSAIEQLLQQNREMMNTIGSLVQQQKDDKLDQLIGLLTQQAQTPKETLTDKLVDLGKALLEKPDIIDRVGYIIRPSIYQRQDQYQEPAGEQIRGTAKTQEEPTMATPTEPVEQKELTEDEVNALNDRLDTAMDKIEDIIGLENLTDIIETLAAQKEEKIAKLTSEKLDSAFKFL